MCNGRIFMKALITGITGQDGSYLAEFLLSKGYEVHGVIRRASTFNTSRIDHIYVDPHESDAKLFLHYGDLSDTGQLSNIIYNVKPKEIYHLGSQSHVRVSFDIPEYTGNITGLGTTRVLDTILRSGNNLKFFHAASSEMFGSSSPPQNENTPFKPQSPYSAAKLYSHWMTKIYREGHNIFASSGIFFNHESPRRGETFVTRKITRAIANIIAGRQSTLFLGNLKSKRDWGFAPDYVEAMWKILQYSKPEDFVIGSGETHSVQEFLDQAFEYAGLDPMEYVIIDPQYYRPLEVDELRADSSKAKKLINWKPCIIFKDLVKIMVDADMRRLGLDPIGEGDLILSKKYPDKWWRHD